MDLHTELLRRSENEPFARLLGIEAVEVSLGRAVVRMHSGPETGNLFWRDSWWSAILLDR